MSTFLVNVWFGVHYSTQEIGFRHCFCFGIISGMSSTQSYFLPLCVCGCTCMRGCMHVCVCVVLKAHMSIDTSLVAIALPDGRGSADRLSSTVGSVSGHTSCPLTLLLIPRGHQWLWTGNKSRIEWSSLIAAFLYTYTARNFHQITGTRSVKVSRIMQPAAQPSFCSTQAMATCYSELFVTQHRIF